MSEKESTLFSGEVIRDTLEHLSNTDVENVSSASRTLLIHNTLDQAVDFECQGDRESGFSNPMQIASVTVAANTNYYATMTDYFPFLRLKATAQATPTLGDLKAWFERGF